MTQTVEINVTYEQDRVQLTHAQKEMVSRRSDGRCVYCGVGAARTLDHIVPTSKGGLPGVENVVLACRSCNSLKCDGGIEEMRHHLALRELGWPKMSRETVRWAGKSGVNIVPYLSWRFWYERSDTQAGIRTRAVIAAVVAPIPDLSIIERLMTDPQRMLLDQLPIEVPARGAGWDWPKGVRLVTVEALVKHGLAKRRILGSGADRRMRITPATPTKRDKEKAALKAASRAALINRA